MDRCVMLLAVAYGKRNANLWWQSCEGEGAVCVERLRGFVDNTTFGSVRLCSDFTVVPWC